MEKKIYVSKFKYYRSMFGVMIGFILSVIGGIYGIWVLAIFGLFIFLGSLYFFISYKKYVLTLSKGKLVEMYSNKKVEQDFLDITMIDIDVNDNEFTTVIYPILFLLNKDNLKVEYRLHDQANLSEVVKWVKENYSNVTISSKTKEYLNLSSEDNIR
ncbi:MAG: hypothetical protein WCO33_02895 [bacterium]